MRVGKHTLDRTPCPERVGALQTIHRYAEKLGDHVVEPVTGLTFNSLGEAYDFYNLYSWEHGFGIRYGKSRLNAEKTKCMQEVVCGCSGKPVKENSRSCREAKILQSGAYSSRKAGENGLGVSMKSKSWTMVLNSSASGLFEHMGMPFCHMLKVMDVFGFAEIP